MTRKETSGTYGIILLNYKIEMKSTSSASFLLAPLFLVDYIRNFFDQKYTCGASSYYLLRYLYVITRGLSRHILTAPYVAFYPPDKNTMRSLAVAKEISRNGYYFIKPDITTRSLCHDIKTKLSNCSVKELGGINNGSTHRTFGDAYSRASYSSARLDHNRSDVISIPEVWKLISHIDAYSIASSYLNCSPILTSVDSWYVVPFAGPNDGAFDAYSDAAQSFHYDMDWIKFVKFFINLDNVDEDSAPFEFVPSSHKLAMMNLRQDRRLYDSEADSLSVVKALGEAGSVFIADTSGYHRDGRANISRTRHVLQVEFAVSTFGAKFQYDRINASCKLPDVSSINRELSSRALVLWQN